MFCSSPLTKNIGEEKKESGIEINYFNLTYSIVEII